MNCNSFGIRTFAILVFFVITGYSLSQDGRLFRVQLTAEDAVSVAHVLQEEGFDILEGTVLGRTLEAVVSQDELDYLRELGFRIEVLDISRSMREIIAERSIEGIPDYSDLSEIQAQMNAAAAAFPNICKVVNLSVTYGAEPTFEGREIFAVKISDNVNADEDEPVMLVVSNYHAREIVTPVLALHSIEQLTTLYGLDPAVTAAVDDYEIWIVPTFNPDGYVHVFEVANLWRKNRRVFGNGVGVDLNRNHAFGWDSICGGSTSVSSDNYRGPAADSEAEIQTMIAFTRDRGFSKVIDYHSSGREVLWSYASSCNTHPFDDWLEDRATDLSIASGYGGQRRPPSANGEHYEWQLQEMGAFSFLVETHTTFQPSFASAQAEAATVWPGVLWMLAFPTPLSGHVTDFDTGQPLVAEIEILGVDPVNGERHASNHRFGRYQMFMPPGQYELTFSAEGYTTQNKMVTIADGVAANLDVALLTEVLCDGDLNGDISINMLDMVLVINDLGMGPGPSDINEDGVVDLKDIWIQATAWGGCL